jgi:predicted small lipoprotein YifL
MKKLLLLLLTLTLIFSFAACGSKPTDTEPSDETEQNENLEGSLEDILAKIYETAELSADFKEYVKTGLQTTEITAERCEYYLGKEGIEFDSAIASEPIMMPSAYELDLVRVKEGADVEQIKNEIKENVDPMKWVCVGIDAENVIVDNIGDVIIVIMSDNEGTALHDAFLALKG